VKLDGILDFVTQVVAPFIYVGSGKGGGKMEKGRTGKNDLDYSLTVSRPSRTRRGIVVSPPRFHSSKETVPSES